MSITSVQSFSKINHFVENNRLYRFFKNLYTRITSFQENFTKKYELTKFIIKLISLAFIFPSIAFAITFYYQNNGFLNYGCS